MRTYQSFKLSFLTTSPLMPPDSIFFSAYRFLSTCPSCARRLPRTNPRRALRIPRSHQRHASTSTHAPTPNYASATAIHTPNPVSPKLQPLHAALELLRRDAANHVNLSRLQLALRGVESRKPVLRLAVLGLGGQRTARTLTRLLIADALGAEGQWESELDGSAEGDQRGLLLR